MSGGILTGKAILAEMAAGRISISPFNEEMLNPSSVDLTLGGQVAVYEDWVETFDITGNDCKNQDGRHFRSTEREIDVKREPRVKKYVIDPERGWLLKPRVAYLMHTAERVTSNTYDAVLDGKSSVGRLFIQIHSTAGFIDVGFEGQYTLEVIVQHPIRVYPGMRIGQVRFHELTGEITDYKTVGHYVDGLATGPIASQLWRSFK